MKNNIVKILLLLFTLVVIGLNGYPQNWDWSNHISGTGNIFSKDIVHDSEGNVIVAAQMIGGATIIGTDPLVTETASANTPLVMKFDPNGILLWRVKIGVNDHVNLNTIVLDNLDNIYIAGGFTSGSEDCTFGSTDVNTISLTAVGQDTYIAKYNASGELQWAKNVATSTALCRAEGLTLDSENNILINGFFRGGAGTTIDFGGGNILSYIGGTNRGNAFVAKFNNSGDFVWAQHFSGSDNVRGVSVTRATNEGSYALFTINGDFTVENTAPVISLPVGQLRWAIVKLDNNGDFVWLRTVSSSFETTVVTPSLVSNSVGDVFIGGSISSTTTLTNSHGLDEVSLTSKGSFDVFGARYNKDGDVIWAKNFGGTSIDRAYGVAVNDNQFSIYGYSTSVVYIEHDTIPLPSPSYGAYNINLDYSGNLLSHTSLSPIASADRDGAIAIDEKGNSFIAGFFASTSIDIGTNTLTNGGGKDTYIAKHTNIHILPTITPIINNASAAGSIALQVFGGGDEPYSYTLSKEGVTIESGTYSVPINLTGLNGGVYKFEVIDNSSRQVTKYYHIFEPTISKVNPLDELNYCQGQPVSVALEVNIPKAKAYQWLKDGVAITGEGTTNYTATEAGAYTIEVTIDGQIGVSNEIVIHVEETPVTGLLTKTPDLPNICEGESVSARLTPGSGGIEDILQYRVNDGTNWAAWTDYVSETVIPTTGVTEVEVQTYRANMYCDPATVVTVSWQIEPTPVSGTLAKQPNEEYICEGTSVQAAFTAGTGGNGIDEIEYTTDGTNWAPYISETIIETTGVTEVQIRTRRTASYCTSAEYVTISWLVNPITIPGTLSGGSNICEGSTSEVLTLTGYIGSVIRWEKSVAPFDTWTEIAHTQETYTSNALTQTTRFRAVVKSGVCDALESNYVEVEVTPAPVAGNITGDNLVCAGNGPVLTLNGYSGTIVRWKYSTDGSLWQTSRNSDPTYYAPVINQPTQYKVEVDNGICPSVSTSVFVVNVEDNTIGGNVTGATSTCEGETSGELTLTGHLGDVVKWQLSIDNGTTWIDINNTTATYTSAPLTQTTLYRAVVKNGVCNQELSGEATITVNPIPEPLISSTSDDLVFCAGDPISVEFTCDIINADAYQWIKDGGVIDGVNLSTYTATESGSYSVKVTVNGCSGLSNDLAIVEIERPAPTISTQDKVEYNFGEIISTTFTVSISDAGSYQWFNNGTAIPSANQSTYTATEIGVYSAVVTVNGCTGTSNPIAITQNQDFNPIITTDDNLEWCEGQDILVNLSVNIANADEYVWFRNDGVIPEASTQNIIVEEDGVYKVKVTVNEFTATSNEIEIVTLPTPKPTISTEDNLTWTEDETISVTFTVDITDADAYQWLNGDEPITDAISTSYEATEVGEYSVLVTKGICTGQSNTLTVTIETIPLYDVTFTVQNTSGDLIENAEIFVDTFDPIVTNEAGVAILSCPEGTYSYQVRLEEYNTSEGEFTVIDQNIDVSVVMVPSGISDEEFLSIKLYPNPFNNEIKISDPELITRAIITSISGQKIMDINLEGTDTINTQKLTPGVYLIRLYTQNSESKIYKMVKNR